MSLVHATNGSITGTHIQPSLALTRSGKKIKGIFGARKSLNSLAYAFRDCCQSQQVNTDKYLH